MFLQGNTELHVLHLMPNLQEGTNDEEFAFSDENCSSKCVQHPSKHHSLLHMHYRHKHAHTNTLGVPKSQLCCSASPLRAYLASGETSSPFPPSSLNTDPQTQREASAGPNTQSLHTRSLKHTVHFPSHTLTLDYYPLHIVHFFAPF